MIKTLFFLGLVVLIMADDHHDDHHDVSWPPRKHFDKCKKETGATEKDIDDYIHVLPAHSEAAECFYGCVFHEIDLIKNDYTFDDHEMAKYIDLIKKNKDPKYSDETRNKYIHMLEVCPSEANKHKPDSDDPKGNCIAAKHFSKCSSRELGLEHH